MEWTSSTFGYKAAGDTWLIEGLTTQIESGIRGPLVRRRFEALQESYGLRTFMGLSARPGGVRPLDRLKAIGNLDDEEQRGHAF